VQYATFRFQPTTVRESRRVDDGFRPKEGKMIFGGIRLMLASARCGAASDGRCDMCSAPTAKLANLSLHSKITP